MDLSFAKLLELNAGNDEAIAIINNLKSTSEANTKELVKLETKANEAIQGRDKAKSLLKDIASSVQIDVSELSGETIAEKLQGGSQKDSELQEKYDAMFAKQSDEFSSKEAEYNNKLKDIESKYHSEMINSQLLKHGVVADVVNEKALDIVATLLKDGAEFENGEIVYKQDGITERVDGRAMTIADRLNAIKNDETNAFLFNKKMQNGGDSRSTSNFDSTKSFKDMSIDERSTLYKTDNKLYNQLKGN